MTIAFYLLTSIKVQIDALGTRTREPEIMPWAFSTLVLHSKKRVSIFVHILFSFDGSDQKSKSWTRKSDGFGGLAGLCAKMHAYTYMQM